MIFSRKDVFNEVHSLLDKRTNNALSSFSVNKFGLNIFRIKLSQSFVLNVLVLVMMRIKLNV